MRVGIDVDGVLACFFKGYEDLTVEVAGEDLFPARYPDILPPCWNWPESYGYSDETMREVWRRIKEDGLFWLNLEPLPGAKELLAALEDSDHEVYFITDRPGVNPQYATQMWLDEQGYMLPNVIISRKGKGVVCDALSIDVYLDDKRENIFDVLDKSPSTEVFLRNYPYNEGPYPGSVRAIDTLAQFEEVIRG